MLTQSFKACKLQWNFSHETVATEDTENICLRESVVLRLVKL